MLKRKIVFGEYDTAAYGWTLTGWVLSEPEEKTNFIDKPGGDGSWDMSTALTEGIPKYRDRTLTVTLECSEGDRLSREEKIKHMVNLLDGMREDIELPDDPFHYINGKLHVARNYNDLAHAAVTVTAVCKPWKFSRAETVVTLQAEAVADVVSLVNNGRRAIVPVIEITGDSAEVLLGYNGATLSVPAGTYTWPDLLLTPGTHSLVFHGAGTIKLTYREAVLE